MTNLTDIAKRANELVDEFEVFEDWMDRYQYLIDLGAELPPIEEAYRTDEYRIKGCQAQVWLRAEPDGDRIHFTADSDAQITKGLIAVLLRVLNDQPAETVAGADLQFLDHLQMKEHLSPTRKNGLDAMIRQIRLYAGAVTAKNEVSGNGETETSTSKNGAAGDGNGVSGAEKEAAAEVSESEPNSVEAESGGDTGKLDDTNGTTAGAGELDGSDLTVQQLEDKIVEAIRTVYDPEIPVNVYDLGLIYGIEINPDRTVHVSMTLTTPNCPAAGFLPGQVEMRVRHVPEVVDARVEITFDPPFTPDMMSDEAKLELGFM